SGLDPVIAFGMGDILLRPQRITANITASGDRNFSLAGTRNSAILFCDRDSQSIICSEALDFDTFTSSGRFDTYSYDLSCMNDLNLIDLETSIFRIFTEPSGGDNPIRIRISKVELVVSGEPINEDYC